jgi:pilus assembly protein CpaC
VPGLMNLPVLGALFRSRDYQEGETELAVIVTPYLVKPTTPADLQTPADGLQIANDAETILLGHLNKVYKAPPAAVAGRTYQGPVGYVIE